MRAAVNILFFSTGCIAAAGAVLGFAIPGSAQPRESGAGEGREQAEEDDGDPVAGRWIPSLSIHSGIVVQGWEGSLESTICPDCAFPDPAEQPLRGSLNGDDLDVTPFVGGSVELMTPELGFLGSARVFVGGEVAPAFPVTRRVVTEGQPGRVESPLPEGIKERNGYSENVALGQGSALIAEYGDLLFGAHAGVAFPFEAYGRSFRLKPLVAWIRYDIDLDGVVIDAQCEPRTGMADPGCNENLGGFLRGGSDGTSVRANAEETFDGIGGGFDLEMDTGRFGPLRTSLFLGGRVYRLMGAKDIEMETQRTFSDALGTDAVRGTWRLEVDEWIYRVGLGLRVHWLGSR